MKKNKSTLLILLSLFVLVPAISFAQVSDERLAKDKRKDEIKLVHQKKSTRSASEIEVEAFTDGKTELEVMVTGFNGVAVVQLVSGRTSSRGYIDVYEMGVEVFSIGTFRPGTYLLRITVGDEIFEGTFDKVTVGR